MKHHRIILALILAILLVCSACGKIRIHTEDAAESPVMQQETPEPAAAAIMNPLTGETEDSDLSAVRPYAVMVNNIIVAQPQVGIGKADWIYELEAEGGITRMMALYTHLQDVPNIGSVRSLRPYFLSLAMAYDAVMLHAGGSEDAYADCEAYQWDHLDGVRDPAAASAVFYRDPNRTANGVEHSLFLHADQVPAYAEQIGFRANHPEGYQTALAFSDASASQCIESASSVQVKLSESKTTSFTFHSETGKYTGFQYGSDYIDGADGEPVQFSNLLVLFTQIQDSHDELGHISVNVVGSGTGYYFTGGKCLSIHWSRDSVNAPFCYTAQDGTPLTFEPGKTYCAFTSADQNTVTFG